MSWVGDIFNGMAQQANYKAQAQIADINAKNAKLQANAQEEQQRRESAQKLGSLRASLAENGVSLTEGTGADLYSQSDKNAEMDALNIRYGGQVKAYGLQYDAQVARMNASNAMTAAYIGAGTKMLTGAVSGGMAAAGYRK